MSQRVGAVEVGDKKTAARLAMYNAVVTGICGVIVALIMLWAKT